MQTSLHIAASGLRHADARQRATAHNSANLTTPETTVVRALGREQPTGQGVRTHTEGYTERRPELAASGAASTGRTTDAVGQAVEQISTVHQAGSLANAVRTSDDMLGSLLDILG
jgi:flagellar basal body rod protein FlgG